MIDLGSTCDKANRPLTGNHLSHGLSPDLPLVFGHLLVFHLAAVMPSIPLGKEAKCHPSTGRVQTLDPGHPNALAPNKRPYHTIIPAMATVDGELYLCYGVMGGFMQPQGHLHVLSNVLDFGMDPQAALNALRFMVSQDFVALEEGLPPEVAAGLERRGHRTEIVRGDQRGTTGGFGGGQVVQRDRETGVLRGASEPRKDGCAVGW